MHVGWQNINQDHKLCHCCHRFVDRLTISFRFFSLREMRLSLPACLLLFSYMITCCNITWHYNVITTINIVKWIWFVWLVGCFWSDYYFFFLASFPPLPFASLPSASPETIASIFFLRSSRPVIIRVNSKNDFLSS